ncbi:alpha 1,2-mannosyltransferase 2.4.1, partial [Haplosporangium sp. Z 27]
MIQAPSRYARIIRTVVPFGAICGLGYLFLITFIPDHFGPTARQISKNELVNVNVVGNVGFMEGIGAIGRALIGEGPQETSQLDYHTEISETDDGSVYNNDLLPDAQQNVLFEKEGYGYIIDNTGVDKDSNVQINQSIDTHLNIQESDQEQSNQIERGQPESQNGYQPRQPSLDEIGEQDDSPLNSQEAHKLDSNSALDLEDDSDEDYAPASSVQEEHLVDQDILSDESLIYEVEKANGVLVILTHEDELQNTRETIRQVEDRFNRDRNYPWVVLSPLPLTARSQNLTKQLSKGVMTFGIIPHEQWSLPKWIDAARVRNNDYAKMKLGMNRTSLLARHKWRYMSGFVAQHELLDKYEFFWRVDPGVEIFCDVEEDPMLALKKSAWSLSSAINEAGVPGAWPIIQKIKGAHRDIIPTSNDEAFLTKESRDE